MLYLFDIDGTLLLSGGAGTVALDQVFHELYGVTGAMTGVVAAGNTDPLIIADIFARRLQRQPVPDEVERILAAYVPHLRQAIQRSAGYRLMPAVVETLDFLGADAAVCLGLATGNIRLAARAKLDRAGLWERFAVGGFGDDSAERAELVARAIERAREHARVAFACEEIVVVGDTPRDVRAARACGVRAIAVATGPVPRDALVAEEPDALLDTLAELPDWHRRHCRGRGNP